MTKILAINGSYRDGGATDQAVEALSRVLRQQGAEVETIQLREHPIGFCLNCRQCMQQPGTEPGECVLEDGMGTLIAKIEQADGYILASPTNMGAVTAVFKRFMERLAVYAYWPWNQPAPVYRKAGQPRKKALLVSSCAAPRLLGRWLFGTRRQLRLTANAIGAKPVGTLFTGLIAQQSQPVLPARAVHRAERLAARLLP